MSSNDLEYQILQPESFLEDFVDSFWLLINHSDEEKKIVLLPDGRFDLFFGYSEKEAFHVSLSGIDVAATSSTIPPKTVIYAVSFKILALEYILATSISKDVNAVTLLPSDFWQMQAEDLTDLASFKLKLSAKMKTLIHAEVDNRKLKMSDLIYASNGAITVQQVADECGWSSRQINRYFQERVGVSLKNYLNILRFRATFTQIKEGKLFPEQHYTDQAHFIREVKKFSNVIPKELKNNKDDRFIQFSLLKKK